jgi:hypothetical protein
MGAAFHPCFTANAISPTGSNETAQGPDPQNLDFNDSKLDQMVNKTVITVGIDRRP